MPVNTIELFILYGSSIKTLEKEEDFKVRRRLQSHILIYGSILDC